MSGRIPQSFIDSLISRVDIVDVVEQRVPLRKKGKDYLACCPFHDEKTPSFSVSHDKQFYYCFGCGASGTVVSFLMEYDHMTFVEAIEELASRAGMEVPHEEGAPEKKYQSDSKELYELLDKCSKFFQQQLREHSQAQRAIDYLKQRGLSGGIARDYGVGYAPPGWDNLLKTFGIDELSQKQLLKVGMLIQKDAGGFYDRFRDRIMFPIIDRRGRTIGFGGRVLGDDTPKYLNSPETPVFHKGRELYGIYQVQKAIRDIEQLLVVEGYMDVVALAQFDIRNAVATLGTATTPDHLEQLFRLTPEVVFCFDGDRAGRDAAWRSVQTALPVMRDGRQIKYVFLPEGEDPDSLVRTKGRDALLTMIRQAMPLSVFFYQHLSTQADINSIDGRARLVELARPLLAKMPQGVFRDMMTTRLAEIARMETAKLVSHLGSSPDTSAQRKTSTDHSRTSTQRSQRMTPVRKAVAMLLHRPSLAAELEGYEGLDKMMAAGMDLFRQLVDLARNDPKITTATLLEHWRDHEHGGFLGKLAQESPLPEEADWSLELKDILAHIRKEQVKQRKETLIQKAGIGVLTDEEKRELNNLSITS